MVVETIHESWLSQMGKSFKGVLVGLALIPIAVIVLFWNEGRAVKTAKTIDEGEKLCVAAKVEAVDPAHEGKLVHMTGTVHVDGTLTDPLLDITAKAVRLRRLVEMYQWEQKSSSRTQKKTGGSKTTEVTYTYEKKWADRLIPSADFKEAGHANPSILPCQSAEWMVAEVALGAFTLSDSLVKQIQNYQALPLGLTPALVPPAGGALAVEAAPAPAAPEAGTLRARMQMRDGKFYLPVDANAGAAAEPKIGDVRVGMEIVPAGPVSIVSCQAGSTFKPFTASTGRSIDWLRTGTHSAAEMVAMERQDNATTTWLLRLGGFVAMLIGFSMLLRPLVVIADVVPFIGSLLGAGAFAISLAFSAMLSLVVIAIGWIAYRPMMGVALLAAGLAVLVAAKVLIKGRPKPTAPGEMGAARM